jgi:hypothetical protein
MEIRFFLFPFLSYLCFSTLTSTNQNQTGKIAPYILDKLLSPKFSPRYKPLIGRHMSFSGLFLVFQLKSIVFLRHGYALKNKVIDMLFDENFQKSEFGSPGVEVKKKALSRMPFFSFT